jgi:hypothetical protein
LNAVLGSVDGSVRFFGLTPTSMKLEGLDRHQRLIDSYKKLHVARANVAATASWGYEFPTLESGRPSREANDRFATEEPANRSSALDRRRSPLTDFIAASTRAVPTSRSI